MTAADEKDALALLRALCEYGGQEQPCESWTKWSIPGLYDGGSDQDESTFAMNLDILLPPYCDTLLGAVMRRLRLELVRCSIDSGCHVSADVRPLHGEFHSATDPEHAGLALGRAMRDAGIISTDKETKT